MNRKLLVLSSLATSLPLLAQEEVDAVAEGKNAFEIFGCMVCHAVEKNDASVRTGPNLHGLFLSSPRQREILDPAANTRRTLQADKTYYNESVRKASDQLAIAENGPTKGTPYPAAMPLFTRDVLPDSTVENIWHYLRTLAEAPAAGPAKVLVRVDLKSKPRDLLELPNEELVAKRTRVVRAPITGSSGRALHVGLPSGINFTFDERFLSVRNIWSGGFLNLTKERQGRGQPGSERGQSARPLHESSPLLQPLTGDGTPVDLEFKQPDVLDEKATERWLADERTFAEQLKAHAGLRFEGHRLDRATGEPVFHLRVGANRFSQTVSVTPDGRFSVTVEGAFAEAQRFRVQSEGLNDPRVENGSLSAGVWTVMAASHGKATFSAAIPGGLVARPILARAEDLAPQPLVRKPAPAGKIPLQLPAGYTSEDWEPPKDLFGRNQLFEPTGIAVAKDGTIVVGTRTAGVWRIRNNQWTLFAEGTYECLGVFIEDDCGDQIVITQKPQLTRLRDVDRDGRADHFETVCDDFGFHANYHEYLHGPVRDSAGNYYITLNLTHSGNDKASWRAGGPFMGSMGGYRGWALRIRPDGTSQPFANGLRSPAGLGVDPDGRLWYAENQGEYVGSSKVVPLEEGKFYGHLSGLLDLAQKRMRPDSPELHFDLWKNKIRPAAVWLPHGKFANSPGNPAWDLTGGKFGPFGRQMFIGDQTLSTLLRVAIETVDGREQGSVMPFSFGLASGVMRPVFLPDGSLLVGQTGRGWSAKGGSQDRLQRISHDGKTIPADLLRVTANPKGFTVEFTQPLAAGVSENDLLAAWKATSWFYTDGLPYGSPEHERRDIKVVSAGVSNDRRTVRLGLEGFGGDAGWVDRIYHLRMEDTASFFAPATAWKKLECYHTLRAIPNSLASQ
jgi:hypothetical protein